MKERVDVSLPASESVTAQITDPETVVENTDMQKGDGAANVFQSDLRWDGVETEAEQSQFKVPTKRKKAGDFQAVRAKKADVEDAYCDDGMESGSVVSSISVTGYSGGGVNITCRYDSKYTANAKYFCKEQYLCSYLIKTEVKEKWFDDKRFSLYDDTSAAVFTVTIRDLSKQDSGTYQCGVDISGQIDSYTEVNLKVLTADCCEKSISLSAAAGGSVNISCKYPQSHSADVKFVCRRSGSDLCAEETSVKENRRWSAEGQIQLYDDREQQLLTGTISHVTQQHSAEYWCGVQSDQGHKSFITRILISVTDKPVTCSKLIKTEKKNQWVNSGRLSLYDDTRAAVFTVTIRDLSEQDSDTYYCGSDISAKVDSYTKGNLNVVTGVVSSISVTGYSGGGVIITCRYYRKYTDNAKYFCKGENPGCSDLIKTEVKGKWFHSGRFSLYDDISAAVFTVTIRDLSEQDSGTYQCASDLSWRKDSYTEVKLNVLTTDCCEKSISLSAAAGGSVNISCKYPQSHSADVKFVCRRSGSDLCAEETSVKENRRWSAEGQIQLYDDREQQLLTGTISHVTQQHSAEYWCGVQSDQGHKSFITRVLINVTGVVSSISVTGYSGGGVNITCRYDRKYTANAKYFCRGEKPKILQTKWCSDLIKTEEKEKWFDDGRFSLYDDTSAAVFTVIIRDLSEQDSGTYQCASDLSWSTDSYTEVNLNVLTADCCEKSISLSAAAGGSVNISCKYPQSHSADVKFVCRRSGSDLCAEETSVKENRRWSAEGQIQLYDDREQQLLTGTISHVTQQHSAEYWCGVQSDQGHKSFITRVLINVTGSSLIIPLVLVLLALIITGLLLLFLFKKHQSQGAGSSSQAGAGKHDLVPHIGCDYEEIKDAQKQLPTNPSDSSNTVYATAHLPTNPSDSSNTVYATAQLPTNPSDSSNTVYATAQLPTNPSDSSNTVYATAQLPTNPSDSSNTVYATAQLPTNPSDSSNTVYATTQLPTIPSVSPNCVYSMVHEATGDS
ncbi:polymeric immunoglobulin receptor-like protein [Labeo rohita]|nr:polymeric immunoglobulin receptor-like protein [Labeo rohita]